MACASFSSHGSMAHSQETLASKIREFFATHYCPARRGRSVRSEVGALFLGEGL